MKKSVRKWLVFAALLAMLLAGAEIGKSVEKNVSRPVSAEVTETIGRYQEGIFHMDIVGWELLMIGSGYLIWAAVSWKKRDRYGYRRMEKNEYAAQE